MIAIAFFIYCDTQSIAEYESSFTSLTEKNQVSKSYNLSRNYLRNNHHLQNIEDDAYCSRITVEGFF